MMTRTLLSLAQSGLSSDTRLQCKDGEVCAPRALVAMCWPDLYLVLCKAGEDSVTLLMPQFSLTEVDLRLLSSLSRDLEVI